MLSGMHNSTSCCVYCDEVMCNMLSHMEEKYQFQRDCRLALTQETGRLCVLHIFLHREGNAIYQRKSSRGSHALYLSFPCRAGYLTLFGAEQNNNNTDPSGVYEEYKKFEGLLTKLARGTLKAGNDQVLQENKCQQSAMMDIGYTSWPLQPMSHDTVLLQSPSVTLWLDIIQDVERLPWRVSLTQVLT